MKHFILALLGLLVLPVGIASANYDSSVIAAYEAGLIQYSDLPDSMKQYVLIINSERGESNRITKAFRDRPHIVDAIEFNDKFQDLVEQQEEMLSFDDALVKQYQAGLITWDELLDSQQNTILELGAEVDATYIPPTYRPTGLMIRQTYTSRPYVAPSRARSYRDTRSAKFRPFSERKGATVSPTRKARMMPQTMEPKQYLTRRSYYFYDQRDEQVADYIRLKARVNPGYTGLPYSIYQ